MFERHWHKDKSYQESCVIQDSLIQAVQSRRLSGAVIGIEYSSAVVTLGVRSCREEDILEPEILKEKGLDWVAIDRGGQATVHSPGQLVLYPILPLRVWKISVKDYVRLLVETTSVWLSNHGIQVRNSKAGVFTQRGKMAFVGVAIHRGVSSHGVSINVTNDLSLFSLIRVCGVSNMNVDSMCRYESVQDMETLFHQWCECFLVHLTQKYNNLTH